jgi:hypothetical protein
MASKRSILLHGLWLTIGRPGAFIWAYIFNLALALLFAMRLGNQFGEVLTHSLAAAPLSHGFDVATAVAAFIRIGDGVPSGGSANALGVGIGLAIYFLLMPGALVVYQIEAPAKLSTMLLQGLLYFWRSVRIWLLMAFVSAIVLAPFLIAYNLWSKHVDENIVGWSATWRLVPFWIVIALVAALLRLYFDLVGVYTAQLGLLLRPNGKPDRRVRRTLLPALRVLLGHFARIYSTFLLLALLGILAVSLTGYGAVLALAQPRVWPIFLLIQAGLFLNLFMRFWQRGAETVLSLDFPILPEADRIQFDSGGPSGVPDPIPNPEPAAPALTGPDDGVFKD